MKSGSIRGVRALFLLGFIVLAVLGVFIFRGLRGTTDAETWIEHTHEVLETIGTFRSAVFNAESTSRVFFLTGDAAHVADHITAVSDAREALAELRRLTADNAEQQVRLRELAKILEERIAIFDDGIRVRKTGSIEAAASFVREGKGLASTARLFSSVARIEEEERRLLDRRRREEERVLARSRTQLAVGASAVLLIMLLAFVALQRDVEARVRAESSLGESNRLLNERIQEAEEGRTRVELLSELAKVLHSSADAKELAGAIDHVLPSLFPEASGSVYSFRSSRNVLELAAFWPNTYSPPAVIEPSQCWALRRGAAHWSPSQGTQRCAHLPGAAEALCVDMRAAAEEVGVVSIELPSSGRSSGLERILQATAGQIALALSNLRLRDELRDQSIRDPLTGLFNRRYLEESAEREIARARRHKGTLSLAIFDLDHFKTFNDRFGHLAGDVVLKEFAALLSSSHRDEDLACRFGGEEFVILLPDAATEAATKRAEQIRHGTESLEIQYRGQLLGPFTVSGGIAGYPRDGSTLSDLIRRADEALYRAKSEGRNRIICTTSGVDPD